MSILIAPPETDVEAVFAEVWSSFIDDASPLVACAPTEIDEPMWSSTVSVTGGWVGMVSIDLPGPLALVVTHRMLAIPEDETVAQNDLVDAVGELANVLGGNVKSLMPGPSTLSLPVVAHGEVATSSELEEACCLHLVWEGQHLRVRVLSTAQSGTAGAS